MSQQNFRYPGVQPFQRSQSDRFFGRDDDSARFLSLILQEKLCVLYGKSGYGKSSLLNAGIQPRLDAETAKGKRRYVAVPIRFLAAGGQGDDNLFGQFDFHLARAMEAAGIPKAADAAALPDTLWGCFKTWQTDPGTVFVLLFDQFEELFSYKVEQQLAFRQQLAELLYSDYPQFLEENEATLPPETVARLAEKTNVHTVLAIRADRVSELDRLRDHLPKIREKWFELRALPLEEAAKALTTPAALAGDFASTTFQFEKSARHKILDFLRDAEGLIDPIQLQILAESFEQRVIHEGLRAFDAGNIGDLRTVIARYYSDKIAAIADPAERLAVRRLCEEGLAQEGEPPIRLSLHAAQIRQFFGIETPLLARLVDARLLRAEAGKGGGATYELPHDTLLGAVLEAKKVRLEEERKAAEARAAEELAQRVAEAEARAEEEKRRAEEAERLQRQAEAEKRKAQKMSFIAIGMAFLACLGLLGAGWLYDRAETERKTAKGLYRKSEKLVNAFYFYADRFALAYKGDQFYFIDKNGDEVAKLGKWKQAEQFNHLGFAKVNRGTDSAYDFLLDTLGNAYPVAYDVKDLREGITALDLSGKYLTAVPEEVFRHPALEILLLDHNPLLSNLPSEIGNLTNLTKLHLGRNQLGALPPEIGKLTNLTWLILSGNQLTSLPPELENLTSLTMLDLSGNQLTSLPPEIRKLTNLVTLNLWGALTTLSPEIKNLTKLTALNLGGHRLTTLPPEIGKLTNLTELGLTSSQLTTLPPEIGKLTNLTKLDLSGTRLAALPPTIGNLTNLTELDLGGTRLTALPLEIRNLTKLTKLNLRDNRLTVLPSEIGNLPNLTELNLIDNRLTTLPPEIGTLTNLSILNLQRNQLTTLPPGIGELTNLSVLNLDRNKLTTLPPEIGKLTNLIELHLQYNQLVFLPPEIGNIHKMSELQLSNNLLTNLPPQIGNLTNLTKLNLLNNQLSTLPSEIGRLTKLTELSVTGNRLTALPPEIGNLTNLTTLYLAKNRLTALPPEIGNLTKLNDLHLPANRLTTLPPEIGNLVKLGWLGLAGNQLTSLPPEIGNLTNLTWLNLSTNQLTALPPEIGNLTRLASLNLSYNQLTDLLPQIGMLTNLRSLDLDDNLITVIIPEIRNLIKLGDLKLSNNPIPEKDRKAIKQRLPKCEIKF